MKNKKQTYKQYTFMKLNRSESKSGEDFVSCTVSGQVTQPTALVSVPSNGKSVISFILPIQNRSQTIKRFCGVEPSIDETGTTWADVTVWGHRAENFARYLQRHPRSVITLVGSMRVEEVRSKQGETYNRVKITMVDFDHKTDLPARYANNLDRDSESNEDVDATIDASASIHEGNVKTLPASDGDICVPGPSTEDPFLPDAA